jgi:AcrR family transcriptional regulator
MPKVSEQHKAEVRERLVRAAFECLREKGYERTTTREILARSGLSAGAFYHYFDSKDDLIAAAGSQTAESEVSAMVERVSAEDPPGVMLAKLAAALLTPPPRFTSLLPAARVQAAHQPVIRKSLSSYDERVVASLASFGRRAQSDGDLLKDIDIEALNELLIGIYESLQARGQSDTWVTSYERVMRVVIQLLAAGASPPGSRYRSVLVDALKKGEE